VTPAISELELWIRWVRAMFAHDDITMPDVIARCPRRWSDARYASDEDLIIEIIKELEEPRTAPTVWQRLVLDAMGEAD